MVHETRAETPQTGEIQARFDQLQARLNAAKIAHLNGTTLDGRDVGYADLKRIAQELIQTNYELQRALYGEVRLKLSVAKLLRRGR